MISKVMKLYYSIFILVFLSCNNNNQDQTYPTKVVENHWESMYNTAKWQLYKHNRNFIIPTAKDTAWYTQLNLDIVLIEKSDTIEFYVNALEGDKKYRNNVKHNIPLFHTIGFDKKASKILYLGYDDGYTVEYNEAYKLYDTNVMNGRFIDNINTNNNRMLPWLIKEATKK